MNQPTPNNKDKGGQNGQKPKTDDSLLLLAVTLFLIFAQTMLYSAMKPQTAKPRVIITGTQVDALQNAVTQDLPTQRENFEDYLKGLMAVKTDGAVKADAPKPQKEQFSAAAWQAYQSYIGTYRKLLAGKRSMIVEFISGTQKYVDQGNDYKAFTAQGAYCYGVTGGYKCGTERFYINAVVRGNLAAPASLVIEEWSIKSSANAAPSSP